eukprot:g13187.t1
MGKIQERQHRVAIRRRARKNERRENRSENRGRRQDQRMFIRNVRRSGVQAAVDSRGTPSDPSDRAYRYAANLRMSTRAATRQGDYRYSPYGYGGSYNTPPQEKPPMEQGVDPSEDMRDDPLPAGNGSSTAAQGEEGAFQPESEQAEDKTKWLLIAGGVAAVALVASQ